VDLVAAVVADEQPLEVMQPGERALDDPTGAAEPGTVPALAARDLRRDPKLPELTPILVVVVAAVGEQPRGPSARPSDSAAHRRHALDQRDQLRDVVAVSTRDRPGKRDPGRVYEKVMLGAVSGSINRARARRGAPFFACT
jgi:hypothetical protein